MIDTAIKEFERVDYAVNRAGVRRHTFDKFTVQYITQHTIMMQNRSK